MWILFESIFLARFANCKAPTIWEYIGKLQPFIAADQLAGTLLWLVLLKNILVIMGCILWFPFILAFFLEEFGFGCGTSIFSTRST